MSSLGKLESFPRAHLARTPTPLEAMPSLTKELGGPSLYVKRDDMTGLAFGGNKARQLEFYFGEAVTEGADAALITGAVQSNFVRSVAAAAAKLGMSCHAQLEERVPDTDFAHRNSGNVLLDKLLGAIIYNYDEGEDEAGADRRLREIADGLKAEGKTPYIIPLMPGHPPLGALGYVVAAQEILDDLEQQNLQIDEIFVASGSTSTHAGLVFGLRALGSKIAVMGVCVRRTREEQFPRVKNRCQEIAELLECDNPVSDADILCMDDTLAPGYGQLNSKALEALRLAASKEGLILDPVYTGKVMAGMVHRIRDGAYASDSNVLFLHTGGHPALFAYETELTKALDGNT